jgi:hypothetical protein
MGPYEVALEKLWQEEHPEDFTRQRDRFNAPVKDIVPPKFQMRTEKDDQEFADLVASIREHGVLEPLIVSRLSNKFRLISGSRRLRAATAAGLEIVPVVIKDLTDVDCELVALAENLQRKDLSAGEKCEALIHLYGTAGYNGDIAARYLSALTNRYYQADKYATRKAYSDRVPVPAEFKRLAEKTGIAFASQWQLLRLRIMPSDILEYASKKKIPDYKVIELATPEFMAKTGEEKKRVIDGIKPASKGRKVASVKGEYSLAQLAQDEKKVKSLSGGFSRISLANVYLPSADLQYYERLAKKQNMDLGSCISLALMFKSSKSRGENKSKLQDWYSFKNRGCVKVLDG